MRLSGLGSDLAALLLADVLLVAGLSKAAVPKHAHRSLEEITTRTIPPGLVRSIAGAECLIGIGWLGPKPLRTASASATILLGLSIAVLGLLAHRRALTGSCGCFGSGRGKPLGVRNATAGLAMSVGASGVFIAGDHRTLEAPALLSLSAMSLVAIRVALSAPTIAALLRHSPRRTSVSQASS